MYSGKNIPTPSQGVVELCLPKTLEERRKCGWMTTKTSTTLPCHWLETYLLESKFFIMQA